MVKQEHLPSILNRELLQNPYLVDKGYRVLPESSYFKTPDSEAVAVAVLVLHGIYVIYYFSSFSIARLVSNTLLPFTGITVESSMNFWLNRDEFQFTVLDQNRARHSGSCIVHFGLSLKGLHYEYDACYVRLITGHEDTQVVQIPQTEDGWVRINPYWLNPFDEFFGQKKVVGSGFIPFP